MNRFIKGITAIIIFISGIAVSGQTVSRNISDLNSTPWKRQWSTASGSFRSINDKPSGADIDKSGSMEIKVNFEGKGFAYYNITPTLGEIPGKLLKVSVWAKKTSGKIPCIFSFKTPKQPKGKKYEWIPKLTTQWKRYQFTIPAKWPHIVSMGITLHNWSSKNVKQSCTVLLNNLTITTDMSNVRNKKSLVSVSALTGLPRNIFLYNQKIKYNINVNSWTGKPLKGKLDITVKDLNGLKVYSKHKNIVLTSTLTEKIEFNPKKYGIYSVNILVKLDGQPDFRKSSRCAFIPEIAKSTEHEKRMSPWGLDIHGGMTGVAYSSIAKLGFCWIRDYAYNIEWLNRGYNNGDWNGWPWYKKMDANIKKSGLKILPSMMKGIQRDIKKHPEPPKKWKDIFVRFMMKFPEYDAFEPDNELDLHIPAELSADNYQAYGKYHKKFAEIVHFMNPDAWASTQGTAGFKSNIVRQMVKEGYFKDIDIINGHFYTGIYPALMSQRNENTGQGSKVPKHFYDRLREFVAAADCDGKNRQSWITEFGWDTLAVKIVSEKEQAAYAQRGFTLGLIGGADKMFWYWNRDTKKTPNTYFDGMGIFDPKDAPKPVAASIAAMIHFLKLPKPVGSFEMGPNTFGHVFRDRGRLVALAFKIDKDKPGQTVEFKTGKLYDMYANSLKSRKQKLDITPVWIDNISSDDPLVKQTVYSLKSRWLMLGAAGDECEIKIEVNNTRKKAVTANLTMTVPKGWKITKNCPQITVPAGGKKVFTLKTEIPPGAKSGTENVNLKVMEGEVIKNMPTLIKVVQPATISTVALRGAPGISDLRFSILNNSLKSRTFKITPALPKSWKAVPETVTVSELKSKTSKDVNFKITWDNNYSESNKAEIKIFDKNGTEIISTGIIPNAISLPSVKNIKFDGNFSEWPATAKIPNWAVGKIGTPEKVELYAAYGTEGLYLGVKIAPSSASGNNPKVFWSMDCLEVCVDTLNDKNKREKYNKTDHQFWIVPQIKEHKAYLGRWKRNNEIAKTKYNIQGIKSFAKKTKNGYVMEILIPKNQIKGFKGVKGNKIGLALNLTAPGRTETITCYWPLPKTGGVIEKPCIWATAEMK